MSFHVGQKVTRIKCGHESLHGKVPDSERGGAVYPEIGGTYTIRQINHWPLVTMLLLEECDNSHIQKRVGCSIEPGFDAEHFRPLTERSTETGMAILRKVADDAKKFQIAKPLAPLEAIPPDIERILDRG